jgi:NAD(P)H-hydrate epimerase
MENQELERSHRAAISKETTVEIITRLPVLPPRQPDSNKGNFGRVLVIAGSRGMSGAALLCGSAALRGGAGLVRVAVPQEILPIVAAGNPCIMTAPMPQDNQGRFSGTAESALIALAQSSDVVALGPGLGKSLELTGLVKTLLERLTQPVVLDADGLNALAGAAEALGQHGGALIITPHPGEFARLLQIETPEVQANRRDLALEFAVRHKLVLVLKGHWTIVTDGQRLYENTTGNPGMATAGSGDVLTGAVAALLGQRLEPFAAAQLGVYLHGLAGDLARDDVGEVGLIASDLLQYLPRAIARTTQGL